MRGPVGPIPHPSSRCPGPGENTMAITPIPGSLGLTRLQPLPDSSGRSSGGDSELASARGQRAPGADRTQSGTPPKPAKQQTKLDVRELKAVSAHSGLEVRFDTLEGSNVTLIRIVDPATGEVVREFPPEGLAKALAEIRGRHATRSDRPEPGQLPTEPSGRHVELPQLGRGRDVRDVVIHERAHGKSRANISVVMGCAHPRV